MDSMHHVRVVVMHFTELSVVVVVFLNENIIQPMYNFFLKFCHSFN